MVENKSNTECEQEPKYVFVLIHGTFSSARTWPTDSLLRTEIRDSFKPCRIHAVDWGGKNRNEARQDAAERLRKEVAQLAKQHPNAQRYVLAHSHGGNATLYALRQKEFRRQVKGVVTLGTPFLHARARRIKGFLRRFVRWLPFRVSFLCVAVSLGFMFFWGSLGDARWRYDVPAWVWNPLYWGSVVMFILPWIALLVAALSGRRIGRRLYSAVRNVYGSQRKTIRDMTFPEKLDTPVLNVRDNSDEAFWLLWFENLATRIPLFLYRVVAWTPLLVLPVVVVSYLCIPFQRSTDSTAIMTFSASMLTFALLVLVVFVFELLCGVLIWFMQANVWAFGRDAVDTYLWCNVSGTGQPDQAFRRVTPFTRNVKKTSWLKLRHCLYYDDHEVVASVVKWLRERET